jgi:hypothetical protein
MLEAIDACAMYSQGVLFFVPTEDPGQPREWMAQLPATVSSTNMLCARNG